MNAIDDVAAERKRQIEVEGYVDQHDDDHDGGELLAAAACYVLNLVASWKKKDGTPWLWPWGAEYWKPKDDRRNLVRAAALIIAEIERLDRKARP